MHDDIPATDADIAQLDTYINRLSGALGHADRAFPFRSYMIGTMLPGKRKSIEPMSARLDPKNVSRMHQKLQHFIATSPWHDDAVLARVRDEVIPQMQDREPIQAWIVDDSGMPKKGKLSVGVGHQYCVRQSRVRAAGVLGIAGTPMQRARPASSASRSVGAFGQSSSRVSISLKAACHEFLKRR